jgi:hypothetical protein
MRYLMSERTAQFVRGLMQDAQTPESVAAGPAKRTRSDAVVEDSFAHPFELRWAASSGESTGGAPKGAWIIWLPKGSLVVDGSEVDFSTLAAASGYPAGWYDLTDSFGDGEVPEEFDLYLQPGAKAEFGIDKSKLTDPVLVASVKGKMVKGVVESALVFSASGAPHPWELRRFVKEPETSGGEPVVEWRVWIPVAALTFIYGSLARKVVADSGTGETMIVSPSISSAMWGSANYSGEVDAERTAAAVDSGFSGKWVKVDVADGGGSVYLRLYSSSTGEMPPSTVELVTDLPGKDATVNHPVSLSEEGFYICIASVDGGGVITQCVRSMLTISQYSDGAIQKLIAGGNGINVSGANGRITISATGGGSGGGGGSTGGGEDSGTGISGTFVFATVPRYDEAVHQLLYTPVSLTFANGRLTAMETGSESVIAQAVEESA